MDIQIPLIEATVLMHLEVFFAILGYGIPVCTIVLNLADRGFC